MITHPLAAPQRRLPLQQSSVVMDASPPCPRRAWAAAQAANRRGLPDAQPGPVTDGDHFPSAGSPGGSTSRREECLITAF
jgi:hypothetical protein